MWNMHKHCSCMSKIGKDAIMVLPFFFIASIASVFLSLILFLKGKKHESLFVGEWAPTLLLIGLYKKAMLKNKSHM